MRRSPPHAQPHKPAHARHIRRAESGPSRRGAWLVLAVLVFVTGATAGVGIWLYTRTEHAVAKVAPSTTTTIPVTTVPPTTTQPVPVSVVPAVPAPCTPAAVPGGAYAVGDSVLVDAQAPLQACTPNIQVNASVSRQWSDGETILRQVMAATPSPSVVVVHLGTNGPITDADFDAMMSILKRAPRVVFVTVHVDRSWQDQVNGVLARGVSRYPNTVLADWQSLAAEHPEWFYADATHLPIAGPGAQVLAWLIVSKF